MRQAIEEGFILDVLQNYTSYKLAFKLANAGKDFDDKDVEKSTATKELMSWVRLHPHNISQKVQIVVEHYRQTVAPLLNGKAKAMVVVGSRLEAVRWQIAIDKYIKEQGYPLKTLVAFSGEVNDKESGPDPFRETSTALNPGLKGRDIREAFKGDEYQILLVANKFQTGFDQPLLCGMYVDKRLDGIQAVQTLSRLNRCHPGKDTTYVLDFVNEPQCVLDAFKTYYTTAQLSDATDPAIILNLRAKLDSTGYYDDFEINRVVEVELNPNAVQSQLAKAIEPVADRLMKRFAAAQAQFREAQVETEKKAAKDIMDALMLFKGDMSTYHRAYTFLSQIFDYGNTEFEKRAIFYKHLIRLLQFGQERDTVDLSQVVLTHHSLRNQGKQSMKLPGLVYPTLAPLTEAGSGQVREKQKAYLTEIIAKLNDLFGGDTTDGDKVSFSSTLANKMMESQTLQKQAANNSREQFANSPDLKHELVNAIIASLDAHSELSSQALSSELIQQGLLNILVGPAGLYDELRKRSA
jgi:type I restriction enzyme R subunit